MMPSRRARTFACRTRLVLDSAMNKLFRAVLWATVSVLATHGLALGAAAGNPSIDAMPATLTFDTCSWNHPGVNPFMGDVVAAVDRYTDIPADVRARLKARLAKREYDDLVSIRRDSIRGSGGHDYGSAIREMHFGTHQLCHAVTRAEWTPAMQERGLVYCEGGHCILVPTVCRNVSRITRQDVGNESAEALPPLEGPLAAVADPLLAMGDDLPPIEWFGPTGAGAPALAGAPAEGGSGGGTFAAGSGSGFVGASGGGVTSGFSSANAASPAGSVRPETPAVAAVPEPQTWALMLAGLAALRMAQRRVRARGQSNSGDK